jgi:hypothetical protein
MAEPAAYSRSGDPSAVSLDGTISGRKGGIRMTTSPPRAWLAVPIGAVAGSVATVAAALTSPELYTDWGVFAAALVVIPLFAVGVAALVTVPLAALRRIAWIGVPVALVISIAAAELVFKATLETGFARWSAARHWAAVERRAAAGREDAERDVCRRLLAQSPIPPPPPPPGASVGRAAQTEIGGAESGLVSFSRGRCAELLAR